MNEKLRRESLALKLVLTGGGIDFESFILSTLLFLVNVVAKII